jgi:hypothetical protein
MSLTGVAALGLDRERAARVVAMLAPFAVLPARLTPRGVYDYCMTLREVGGDDMAAAALELDVTLRRLNDRRYYPSLPSEVRALFIAGAHFAYASLTLFHARGTSPLESADVLDELGFELYSMIASQIRCLYYTIRADFAQAAPHREQVELHAARMGSIWQVETWEAIALSAIYKILLVDIVGTARLGHRIEVISRRVPSLQRYHRLVEGNLVLIQRDARFTTRIAAHYEALPARSFLGWSTTLSLLARGFNQIGEHARAKAICERVQSHMTDGDHDFVGVFLVADVELALADAGLGSQEAARQRLLGLVRRFEDCDHPLLQGLLQEALAQVAWYAHDREEFAHRRLLTERWFRPTGVPALIAKCERLEQLEGEMGRQATHAPSGDGLAMTISADRTVPEFDDALAARDTVATGPSAPHSSK